MNRLLAGNGLGGWAVPNLVLFFLRQARLYLFIHPVFPTGRKIFLFIS